MEQVDAQKQTFMEYLKTLAKSAKRFRAGSMLTSFKKADALEGADVYILVVRGEDNNLSAVQSLVNSMLDEDDDE